MEKNLKEAHSLCKEVLFENEEALSMNISFVHSHGEVFCKFAEISFIHSYILLFANKNKPYSRT